MRKTILHLDYLAKLYNHSEAEVERIIDFLLRLVKFDPQNQNALCSVYDTMSYHVRMGIFLW